MVRRCSSCVPGWPLGTGLGSTRQAVSQHLDVLEDAGWVTTARQGRYKFHHVDTTPLHVITDRWLPSQREDKTWGLP